MDGWKLRKRTGGKRRELEKWKWVAASPCRNVVAEMSDYLNTDEALCLSSSLLMTCSSKPDKRPRSLLHHACHNTDAVNTSGYICVCVCVCVSGGFSHSGSVRVKVPLTNDRSPLPCQRVLARRSQTHSSHQQSNKIVTTTFSISFNSFFISPFPLFPIHSLSSACCASTSIEN